MVPSGGATVQETTKTTVSLVATFVVATGYMVFTLNGRMDSLERRMDRIEAKIDTLDEKFDKLLIALAGRGFILPAKPDRMDPEERK